MVEFHQLSSAATFKAISYRREGNGFNQSKTFGIDLSADLFQSYQ